MARFSKGNDKQEQDEFDLQRVRNENERLKERVDYLSRVVEGMWTLLRDPAGLSDARLMEEVKRLKEEEKSPEQCPMCDRPLSLRTNACNYCGTRVERSRVF